MKARLSFLFVLSWAVSAVSSAVGDGYSFSKIIDSSHPTYNYFYAPSLNDNGEAVFVAYSDSGYLVRSDGTTTVEVAGAPDFFTGVPNWPGINNAGDVAFRAYKFGENHGAFLYSGGAVTTLDADPAFNATGSIVDLNSAGEALYTASSATTRAIYLHNGTSRTTIADDSGVFSGFGGSGLDDSGQVAFVAEQDDGTWGVYLYSGGTVSTLAETGAGGAYASLGVHLGMNSVGTVAFYGEKSGAGYGIYDGSGQALITPGVFGYISSVSLNDSNEVAFTALHSGEYGMYAGSDPAADKIVRIGDSLFGSTLTGIDVHQRGFAKGGLNNLGQIAFAYELANGESGIAIATPTGNGEVPAPSALVGLVGLAAVGLAMALRRRRGRKPAHA